VTLLVASHVSTWLVLALLLGGGLLGYAFGRWRT
jgi:hypothetical protein